MSDTLNRNRFFRLLQFVQKPWVLHVLVWIMVFGLMLMAGSDHEVTLMEIVRKLINLAFYILVVYINLGYLVPKFLNQLTGPGIECLHDRPGLGDVPGRAARRDAGTATIISCASP